MYYDKFKGNKYSQNGEDGVLSVLISELEIDTRTAWVVDVGAWDGVEYSNVRTLIDEGCNAVMIEPMLVGGLCEKKYEELKELPNTFPNVHTFNAAVVPSYFNKEKRNGIRSWFKSMEESCNRYRDDDVEMCLLDDILRRTDIPKDYDILNIDTDYCDHEIWPEHKEYKPKIVIIEIDSSIPPEIVSNKTPQDSSEEGPLASFGYSLNVASSMGYSLVCHTGNIIYVRDDLLDKLSIPNEKLNTVELFNRSWM